MSLKFKTKTKMSLIDFESTYDLVDENSQEDDNEETLLNLCALLNVSKHVGAKHIKYTGHPSNEAFLYLENPTSKEQKIEMVSLLESTLAKKIEEAKNSKNSIRIFSLAGKRRRRWMSKKEAEADSKSLTRPNHIEFFEAEDYIFQRIYNILKDKLKNNSSKESWLVVSVHVELLRFFLDEDVRDAVFYKLWQENADLVQKARAVFKKITFITLEDDFKVFDFPKASPRSYNILDVEDIYNDLKQGHSGEKEALFRGLIQNYPKEACAVLMKFPGEELEKNIFFKIFINEDLELLSLIKKK